MPTFLEDDLGHIITTGGGVPIVIDEPTSNNDIQMFDFSVNLLRAILWQYNDAVNLQSIIQQKQDWYNENQQKFWEDWIKNVFNLMTANDFGLDVWSIILDFPLFVNQSATPAGVVSFGFDAGSGQFDNSTFGSMTGGTNALPTETKRIALQLRYFQLCNSGTVPEINRFMNYIFANYGKVILQDNNNMTQQYIFLFTLTWDQKYLFDNFDILPRPAGVKSSYRDIAESPFGFGPGNVNFDNSTFGR